MASTYGTPVSFTKEKNVWFLSARITFDQNGKPALDSNNSKGFCAVWQNTPTFTMGLNGSSSTTGSVSSFKGLFSGMNLTIGSSLGIITTATIGSITAALASAGSLKVTAANNAQSGFPQFDVDGVTFTAGSGGGGTGQYILQLGQLAATRLDTYVKLLNVTSSWDESSGSASGQALQQQLAPNAPTMVLISNNVSTRTVPATQATASTDASITVQFGAYTTGADGGRNFQAKVPAPGEVVRICLMLGNSTSP